MNIFVALFIMLSCSLSGEVITPNVGSLPWAMDGDVKVFHLIA